MNNDIIVATCLSGYRWEFWYQEKFMLESGKKLTYRFTLTACSLGYFVLAAVINLTPILFIPLREQYGYTFSQLGFLVFINFSTQVTFDLVFSKAADRYGFRPFVLLAHAMVFTGFALFGLSSFISSDPYWLIVAATFIFSGGGGLLELLISPIVDSVPNVVKSTTMAFLHSFYAWGQVTVVLLTTVLLFTGGTTLWPVVVLCWTLLPAVNFFLFRIAPLAPGKPMASIMRRRDLIRQPFFLVALTAILFGAAAEVTMNQWTSAFMEKALELPKVVGDILGMCLFAAMLGAGRVLYGIWGEKLKIGHALILGSLLAAFCYLTVSLTANPVVGLMACAVCGLAVSLLWPGTLVIAAGRFPLAGASLFAILAAGGDIGAAIGPWAAGLISEAAPAWFPAFLDGLNISPVQFGLRAGMLSAVIFPLAALACHIWLSRQKQI